MQAEIERYCAVVAELSAENLQPKKGALAIELSRRHSAREKARILQVVEETRSRCLR